MGKTEGWYNSECLEERTTKMMDSLRVGFLKGYLNLPSQRQKVSSSSLKATIALRLMSLIMSKMKAAYRHPSGFHPDQYTLVRLSKVGDANVSDTLDKESTDGAINIKARDQQNITLASTVTDERALSTDFPLSASSTINSTSIPATITAPAHHFGSTDPPSQDLATLLSFLGQSKISERLLKRARGPLMTWGEDGEVAIRNVNMIEVVQNEILCENAIYALHQLRAIDLESSTVEPGYISVNLELLARIAHDKDRMRWKSEAVKIVFYAFPMDRRLVPLYSFSIATSILPLLEHVLPFLEEIDMEKTLPPAYVIEVCLSASYYSTLDWKGKVIAVAENIAKRYPVGAQLPERIALRKRILSRLSSCEWGSEVGRLDFIRVDQRTTGYYGDFVLFNADVLFGRQQLQAALDELNRYTPWHPKNISTLEHIQICEINFLRGKIHHFSGHFKEASRLFKHIMYARRPESSMMSKAMAHLTAVCCELGETRLGIDYASGQLNDIIAYQSRESGSAKRLRLALAYAYLMQGLWAIFNQPTASGYTSLREDIQQGFDKA